jgi:hypothetical protein
MHDELRKQRVVVERDLKAFLDASVPAYTRSGGDLEVGDDAG